MRDRTDQSRSPSHLWRASYRETGIAAYAGNPMIETLPPIYSNEQAFDLLGYDPVYREPDRHRPPHERLHLLLNANRFFQPLIRHFELEQSISRMVRSGYIARNPLAATYWPQSRQKARSVRSYVASELEQVITQGLSLVGISGTGKSRTLSRILHMYPQGIVHSSYRGRPFTHVQLVWLKLDCPHDGSLVGLCKDFFMQVDLCLQTNYYQRYAVSGHPTLDTLIISMATVCRLNSIGVLVIDEIQYLRQARGDSALRLLNFLTQLDNTIGVPVIVVGTPAALPALTGEFRRARRAEGQGEIPWDRMGPVGEWDVFLESLWKYQYVSHDCPLTPELRTVVYDASQGIPDIAIKLYILAQIEAIADKSEQVTVDLIRQIADDRFRFVQPYLQRLRKRGYRGSFDPDMTLDDITMPGFLPNIAQIVTDTLQRLNSPLPSLAASASGPAGVSPGAGETSSEPTRSGTDPETPLTAPAGSSSDEQVLSASTTSPSAPSGGLATAGQLPAPPAEISASTTSTRGRRVSAQPTNTGMRESRAIEQTSPQQGAGDGQPARRKRRSAPAPASLVGIVTQGVEKHVTPYDALAKQNILRPAREFLSEER